MRVGLQKIAISLAAVMLGLGLCISTANAAGKSQTFSGTVSDAMCGTKHMMPGSAADCTHACVQKGANYALVVGDKAYTLETSNKADLDQLDKLAGQSARITGSMKGDTITVSSVAAGQ